MNVLVIDAGTSTMKAAIIAPGGEVLVEQFREVLPSTPAPGLVEFDAHEYRDAALELARTVMAQCHQLGYAPVAGVSICNQRASCIVWDPATGLAVAPAQGWQDLRTIMACLTLAGQGWYFAPNQTATKAADILDSVDPDRSRGLLIGTPDSWLIWNLTEGAAHVTDPGNAGVTGLMSRSTRAWDPLVLNALNLPAEALPTIVASIGTVGEATALEGSPPIVAIAGDQQASMAGQGCVRPGLTKITFGTGAMLDLCLGERASEASISRGARSDAGGTFGILCWEHDKTITFGLEAIMLSAGTNVQWLRDDLGLIDSAEESAQVAATCEHTDGVIYVPAQLGLGTPHWDYGARSALFGMTRGTQARHIVRAVLEGVAHRGADLVEAAELDAGFAIDTLRIDGGMSANPVFRQALANATGRRIEVSPHTEATTVGAAALAHLALGALTTWDDVAGTWKPQAIIEPTAQLDREAWQQAVAQAGHWYEDLSALNF